MLTVKQCDDIYSEANRVFLNMKEFFVNYDSAIKNFNGSHITQEFFASGEFGKKKEEEITAYVKALQEYYDTVKILIEKTKDFAETQKDLLTRGSYPNYRGVPR